MTNTEVQQPHDDLLSDFESRPIQANVWKRFGNYLIDRWLMYVILSYIVPHFVQLYIFLYGYEQNLFRYYLVNVVVFVLYTGMMESLFRGKTLGKMLTQTRAVNEDGSMISPKTAFLRSFSRLVPFEAFSVFGNPSYPWHDRWTHTYVIDERKNTFY